MKTIMPTLISRNMIFGKTMKTISNLNFPFLIVNTENMNSTVKRDD